MILILIAFCLLIILAFNFCQSENFETSDGKEQDEKEQDEKEQRFDKIFEKVDYYPNLYDNSLIKENIISELISTGIDKCNKECSGTCVEFGITGIAYCFNPIEKKYSRQFINHEFKKTGTESENQ